MLVESISVGREFCKFMVGVSTGAIPLYLALLQLALPKDYRPELWGGVAAIAPATGFLAAASAFALGVFPRSATFSLDRIDEISAARDAAIQWRGRMAVLGFTLFAVSVLSAVVVAVGALRVEARDAPAKPVEVRVIR
jgi:hypothetical protein